MTLRYVLLLLLFAAVTAQADERILSFHSEITINPDGSLDVAETISVRAEGRQIRRGLYRDYPTRYKDRFGGNVTVDYEPLSLLRNGNREDFHYEDHANGVRTYFGSADRLLTAGEHTYVYRYRADRMLGFFETRDELYWNVTGLDWAFPIDEAAVTVIFGFAVSDDEVGVNAYTGRRGATGDDFTATVAAAGLTHVETTRPLGAGEGLTVAVTWPKGLIAEPGLLRNLRWWLRDYGAAVPMAVGLIAMFVYYFRTWSRHGKDPEAGPVVVRYEPPAGYSPASLRYVDKMDYDDTAMTAAIVNLAVKGYLSIDETGGKFTLQKQSPPAPQQLAAGEQALLNALFGANSSVLLEQSQHRHLITARKVHSHALHRDYSGRYFLHNSKKNMPAVLIAAGSVIISAVFGSAPGLFIVVFGIAMFIVGAVFAVLLRRPTDLGRELLDQVAGFREYLEIAEKDELNLRNPPEKTPQLFEQFLPFALALGVDQQWSEKFESILARAQQVDGKPYQPTWYSGSFSGHRLAAATAGVGNAVGKSISSAATPPGSSSGGGGGGFSGGGGGGGGGGGW